MSQTTKEITSVSISEKTKVFYEQKDFLIFTWFVRQKSESFGKDLVINTNEVYEKIIVNGKRILCNKCRIQDISF